jgi:hypothetical protein
LNPGLDCGDDEKVHVKRQTLVLLRVSQSTLFRLVKRWDWQARWM